MQQRQRLFYPIPRSPSVATVLTGRPLAQEY